MTKKLLLEAKANAISDDLKKEKYAHILLMGKSGYGTALIVDGEKAYIINLLGQTLAKDETLSHLIKLATKWAEEIIRRKK